MVDQDQARNLSVKGKTVLLFPDGEELGPYAMVRILRKKQGKRYQTGGAPVDLLLYFSKDYPIYLPDILPKGMAPTEIELAAKECRERGPFSRIWTYCSWDHEAKLLAT